MLSCFANVRFVAFLGMFIVSAAGAQTFPSKSISIILPYPPGGATDIGVRTLVEQVSRALGQSVLIENRSGAAGAIGTVAVARSPADGYTILANTELFVSGLHFYPRSYDPFKDFTPVVQLSFQPVVLAVHPSLNVGTLRELIAELQKRPGMHYATGGAGSNHHFAAEWFAKVAGVQLVHVPYKGGSQAIADVLGGQVKLISLSPTPLIPLHRTGKLKIIAQAGASRVASLQDVPTYRESGVAVEMGQWTAIFAPANTPRDIVLRLNTEFRRALDAPAVRERYASVALEPVGGSPEQLGELVRRDYDMFGRLKKELQITAD